MVGGIDHPEPVHRGPDTRWVSHRHPESDALTVALEDDRVPLVLHIRHPKDPSQERRCRFRPKAQCLVVPAPHRGERFDIVA
jgi:hypothetical protein